MAKKTKKNPGGRPRKELESIKFDGWEQLEALAIWADAEYCASQLGFSKDTLERRIKEKYDLTFAAYKDKKKERIRRNLRLKQYEVAMTGNVSMLIWLGKNELGQQDKQEVNQKITEIPITIDEQDLKL